MQTIRSRRDATEAHNDTVTANRRVVIHSNTNAAVDAPGVPFDSSSDSTSFESITVILK
jgi:hypothetical protein